MSWLLLILIVSMHGSTMKNHLTNLAVQQRKNQLQWDRDVTEWECHRT